MRRRLTLCFLLLCLLLGLGDAPYVDEYLDDVAQAVQRDAGAAGTFGDPGDRSATHKSAPRANTAWQLLFANINGAPTAFVSVAVHAPARAFPAEASLLFASASPRRPDRPPARLRA